MDKQIRQNRKRLKFRGGCLHVPYNTLNGQKFKSSEKGISVLAAAFQNGFLDYAY